MDVAEREIYLAISRILWCFRLSDVPGEPVDLNEYDGLSGRSPTPFKVQLAMRHDEVLGVLDKEDIGGLR